MKLVYLSIIGFLLMGCTQGGTLFERAATAGTAVVFSNDLVETDDLNILDYLYFYNGGGVAVGDINNDGLPDIYFSGNQVQNALYLNKGNFKFEDITQKAGVSGASDWNTGVTMADVNGDGLLDIYVCAVVGINGFGGHNELYINNGDLTFSEKSREMSLDFESFSSSASFFDYDLDGDLDLYLLNHAVHTSESFGNADLRLIRNYETGDKLMRNDNGRFVDVSEEAGIYGGINGYGLGLAVSDFDANGYPDIYVGNDFHEDDYYYLNNGDGTFTESLRQYFGHTSRFSMGNDVADINHDGRPDLISLDMLAHDETVEKSSEGEDDYQVQKMRIERFGYHYQFTRNMLYINQPDGNFTETALLSGVAATDWSWSALFGDYDQDGNQDLFVANGIPRRPNNLDYIRFVSSEQIQNKINNTKLVDGQALELMPSGKVGNFVFQGNGSLGFEDKSSQWMPNDIVISNSIAYGDLDNDGDLDMVANNLNHPAIIYKNTTNAKANYLKVKLQYLPPNTHGIGAKAYVYCQGQMQFKELFPSRGFQASSEPIFHFGLGQRSSIDSLRIVWPDKTHQTLVNVKVNQELVLAPNSDRSNVIPNLEKKRPLFEKDTTLLGIHFTHLEDNYLDFNREKLIPYRISDRGPAFAKGDLNGDGTDDLFFGGSKFQPPAFFAQVDGVFEPQELPAVQNDSVTENVSAVIADFNGDGKNDLLLGNGGGDFYGEAAPLYDRLYVHGSGGLQLADFQEIAQNTSILRPYDFDGDGDLDVFLGGHALTGKFGEPVKSFLLNNSNGAFKVNAKFDLEGMVTDAVWTDFDGDGAIDLIVIGEWMAPRFYKNSNGTLEEVHKNNWTGLWQTIVPFDIDGDGDMDYLLGNWGLNSKFTASEDHPLRLYFSDFDGNGQTETVTALAKNGTYYTTEGLDDLSQQMVSLRKKFTSYQSFAGKSIDAVFDQEQLKGAKIFEVSTLASGYLENKEGDFYFQPFPDALQTAPLTSFVPFDSDNDGNPEILAGGNYFGVKPYHGRFDSFPGALIKSKNDIILGGRLGLDFTKKSIRHLDVMTVNGKQYLTVVYNNEKLEVYKINSN